MSRALLALLIAGAAVLVGCSTTPREPDRVATEVVADLDYRPTHPPYGSIEVEPLRDRRPSYELGRENYLNESYYSEDLFRRPVPATLRRVAERELVTSGVFAAAPSTGRPHYLLRLTLIHFTARADRDLLGLIPVVPSVEVEARFTADVLLTDRDGRRFLEKRYDVTRTATTSTLGNVESTSADLLLMAMGDVIGSLVRDADQGVDAFWRELGFDPVAPAIPGP
ncbi:MAG: hypothetical protein R3F20_11645 [Planctomycetota bacterium]